MDDFLSFRRIDGERYLYISSLSKSALSESSADHLGDYGYFLYECGPEGIEVLAKVASFEAALRLFEIYEAEFCRAVRLGERKQARSVRRAMPMQLECA